MHPLLASHFCSFVLKVSFIVMEGWTTGDDE
jgi:hypothetical protein